MTASLTILNPYDGSAPHVMTVERTAIRKIVSWYSAYAGGDPISVMIDGQEAPLDHNSELVEGFEP